MNYFEIGQRIRKVRKAHGMSQEKLAECVEISVTHMSHIETGNTKLSLPVLVKISEALDVRTDDLLFDPSHTTNSVLQEDIAEVLTNCSVQETKIIAETVKAMKNAMDKHL